MSARHLVHTSIMAAPLLSAGCAVDCTQSSSEPLSSKEQARHLAFAYRQQAADIRELARCIELEALFARRQSGLSHEESTRRLAQAKELFAAAEEADELADDRFLTDTCRRAPSGMRSIHRRDKSF